MEPVHHNHLWMNTRVYNIKWSLCDWKKAQANFSTWMRSKTNTSGSIVNDKTIITNKLSSLTREDIEVRKSLLINKEPSGNGR